MSAQVQMAQMVDSISSLFFSTYMAPLRSSTLFTGEELGEIVKVTAENDKLKKVCIDLVVAFPWMDNVLKCKCSFRDIAPVQVAELNAFLQRNMEVIDNFQSCVFNAFMVAAGPTAKCIYNDSSRFYMLTRKVTGDTAAGLVTLVMRWKDKENAELIHAFEHIETMKMPATALKVAIQTKTVKTAAGEDLDLEECIPELEGLKIRVHMENNGTLIYTHKNGLIKDTTELLEALRQTASTGTVSASKELTSSASKELTSSASSMLKELCGKHGSIGIVLVSPENTRLKSCVIENANTPSKAYITSAYTPLGEITLRKAGSLKTAFEAYQEAQEAGFNGYTAYIVRAKNAERVEYKKLMAEEHQKQFEMLKPYGNDGILPLSEVAKKAIALGKAKEYEAIMNPQLVAEFQRLCNELIKDRPEQVTKLKEFISANHAELYKPDSELCSAVKHVGGDDGKIMLDYIQKAKDGKGVTALEQLRLNMREKPFWTASGVAKKSVEAKMLDAMKKIRKGVDNEKIKEITRNTLKAALEAKVPVRVPAKATAVPVRVTAAKALLAVAEAKAALAVALAEAEAAT